MFDILHAISEMQNYNFQLSPLTFQKTFIPGGKIFLER